MRPRNRGSVSGDGCTHKISSQMLYMHNMSSRATGRLLRVQWPALLRPPCTKCGSTTPESSRSWRLSATYGEATHKVDDDGIISFSWHLQILPSLPCRFRPFFLCRTSFSALAFGTRTNVSVSFILIPGQPGPSFKLRSIYPAIFQSLLVCNNLV
jgi:hypothetical protein